ncbi:MAG: hypothetical protein AB1641_18590 [Thermodesulfobacteriota bacterium]
MRRRVRSYILETHDHPDQPFSQPDLEGRPMTGISSCFLMAPAVLLWLAGCADLPQPGDVLNNIKAQQERFAREVQDLTVIQEVEQTGEAGIKGRVTLLRSGNKVRLEASTPAPGAGPSGPEFTAYFLYDGQASWLIAPVTGKKKYGDGERLPYDGRLFWWEADIKLVKVVGAEKIGDREAVVIEIQGERLSFSRLWVDRRSLAQIKALGQDRDGRPIELVFSDFHEVGGFEMPYRTEMKTGGLTSAVIQIESVTINLGLSPDLFDPEKIPVPGPTAEELRKELGLKKSQEPQP